MTGWVLTAGEAAVLRDAGSADELESAARVLRARWVAEALHELVGRLGQTPNGRQRHPEVRDIASRLVDEYRDGRR
jgi:hypothetical protein